MQNVKKNWINKMYISGNNRVVVYQSNKNVFVIRLIQVFGLPAHNVFTRISVSQKA